MDGKTFIFPGGCASGADPRDPLARDVDGLNIRRVTDVREAVAAPQGTPGRFAWHGSSSVPEYRACHPSHLNLVSQSQAAPSFFSFARCP
jgi:hypothetical protein